MLFRSLSLSLSLCLFLFLSLSATLSYGQSINSKWKDDLNQGLIEFMACENTAEEGVNPCNKYVGASLQTVYKINDFYSKEQGRHMLVAEISDFLKDSKQWNLLGYGYEQKALNEAQNHANANKAVVAVYLNEEGIGHISLILPGEMKFSGTWGFQVPNSAGFFTAEPEKSYIEKGLSYSFEKSRLKKVLIYARNY